MTIDSFQGPYRFLSNFELSFIEFEGLEYKTVEHAYQAAKTLDPTGRVMIQCTESPGAAKKMGRKITMRSDWDKVKLDIMLTLLRKKFENVYLAEKLLDTGDVHLEEGNWWNDTFWGVCRGKGSNHLGCLLMQVRQELRDSTTAD